MSAPQRIAEVLLRNEVPGAESPAETAAKPVGPRLKSAREAKGLSLAAVQHGTKVKIAHLAAIEAGDSASLPPTPFVAGFVKAYAQFLGLNPEEFSSAYKTEAAAAASQPRTSPEAVARPAEDALALASVEIIRSDAAPSPAAAVLPLGSFPRRPQPPPATAAKVCEKADNISTDSVRSSAPAERAPSIHPAVADADSAAAVSNRSPSTAWRSVRAVLSRSAQSSSPARTGPDGRLSYFGMGAACVVILWFGVKVLFPEAAHKPTLAPSDSAAAAPIVANAEPPIPPENATVAEDSQAGAKSPMTIAPDADKPAAEAPVEIKAAAPKRPPATPPRGTPIIPAEPADTPTPSPDESPAAQPDLKTEPVVRAAGLITAAEPKYPDRCAGRAGKMESVDIMFDILPNGRPANARIVQSSNGCFNSAAVAAANRMRFAPRTVDGRAALEESKLVTVQFAR